MAEQFVSDFDLQDYLTKGVEGIVAESVRATLKNPKEAAFMMKFAAASRRASKKRRSAEDRGEHIPPFLIASITSNATFTVQAAIRGAITRRSILSLSVSSPLMNGREYLMRLTS